MIRRPASALHILVAVIFAASCVLVLSHHVYWSFERIRVRVVRAPLPPSPSVSVTLPDLSRLAGTPAAFVFRVRNQGDVPAAINADLQQGDETRRLVSTTIGPNEEVRLDAAADLSAGPGARMTVTGNTPRWQLTFLEIANVHGHSTGPLAWVIVPRARQPDIAVPWWVLAIVFAALLAVQPRLHWPAVRSARLAHRVMSAAVLALLLTVFVSDLMSPYRVMLSPLTFLLCAVVLYGEPLARAGEATWQRVRRRPTALRVVRGIGHWLPHIALTAVFLTAIGGFYEPANGFTSLIRFGEEFAPRAVPTLRSIPHRVEPGTGYDGEFYAQIALDPLLRDPATVGALDAPSYRARRILLPAVAHALGLGSPRAVLQIYALLNVFCWLLLGWVLLRWLPPGELRPTLAWIACMANGGLLFSVMFALTDGPSVLFIALAVLLVERKRIWSAAGVIGAAVLARETNILAAGVAWPSDGRPSPPAVARTGVQIAIMATPLVLWGAYLWHIGLPPETGGINFGAPFSGYLAKWTATIAQIRAEGIRGTSVNLSVFTIVAFTTQALTLACVPRWRDPWWRVGICYVGLMIVLSPTVWGMGELGGVDRALLPMTVAFNVLVPKHRWFWPLWTLGNLGMLLGLSLMRVIVV